MTELLTATEAPPWTDRGAFWVAVAAAVFSLAAVVVAIVAARHAKASAASAARVAGAEVERDHRDCHPRDSTTAFGRHGVPDENRTELAFTFTPARSYRVSVYLVGLNKRKGLEVPNFAKGHKPVTVILEDITGREASEWESLEFLFWPPDPGDPGEVWSCPCGRDLDASNQRAHWTWSVPVEIPPAPWPVQAWAFRS